jgi:hypothetical protein
MGNYDPRHIRKLPLQGLNNLIQSFQLFYQGIWLYQSGLKQLPHIGDDNLKILKRKLKKDVKVSALQKMDPVERLKIFEKKLDDAQYAELESTLATLPNLNVLFPTIKPQGHYYNLRGAR